MSLFRNAAIASALTFAGCGAHAHVSASDCSLHDGVLSARVTNSADRPVVRTQIQADFYVNYRFTRAKGDRTFVPVLDPGTSRIVDFPIEAPKDAGSAPMKCVVSRAFYGDNTLEDF